MLQKQARFIAILMVCVILAFAVAVPFGYAKKVPKWLYPLWLILTTLEDILSGIDRLIAAITKDVEDMEDAIAGINDELDTLYPRRDKKEADLREYEGKLAQLEAEHQAALDKRSAAQSRIRSLNRQISQILASLSMLSGSNSETRAYLEAQLRKKRSELAQAKQDVKDANKIIHSQWRAIKRSWYKAVIGDSFNGLKGELTALNGRIGNLETLADNFAEEIKKQNQKKKDEGKRRKAVQGRVDKARNNYNKAKKNGDPNQQK